MKLRLLIVIMLLNVGLTVKSGTPRKESGNLYSIVIGINDYNLPGKNFNNCVRDGKAYAAMLEKHNGIGVDDNISGLHSYHVDTVFTTALYDESATLMNIINAFRNVAKFAKPNDVFSLFIAGYTGELPNGSTVLFPYSLDSIDLKNVDRAAVLNLSEIANLMNQINCYNQLVVSESGIGSEFASNLLSALFESNPALIKHNAHNRIILTTKFTGMDSHYCGQQLLQSGPLLSYILKSDNPLTAIFSPDHYELKLIKAEAACPVASKRYCNLYNERDYSKFIASTKTPDTRGGKHLIVSTDPDKSAAYKAPKTYGLFIATDTYSGSSTWSNLANPIRDAETIGGLLASKFDVDIVTYYNADINDVWKGMDHLFDSIREQDKLLVFIAGHGYYDEKTGTAALPMINSLDPSTDFRLTTYLEFSWLQQRLDLLPTKNVFVVFDVCFGANFDANAKDVVLSNYDEALQDISLDVFETRMNENKTRIFLASGKFTVPDYWNNSLDHSPFAAKIIYGLQRETSFTSPSKLYSFAKASATKPELKYFGQHHTHTDFILKVKQ